jgi:hypothetical protein
MAYHISKPISEWTTEDYDAHDEWLKTTAACIEHGVDVLEFLYPDGLADDLAALITRLLDCRQCLPPPLIRRIIEIVRKARVELVYQGLGDDAVRAGCDTLAFFAGVHDASLKWLWRGMTPAERLAVRAELVTFRGLCMDLRDTQERAWEAIELPPPWGREKERRHEG